VVSSYRRRAGAGTWSDGMSRLPSGRRSRWVGRGVATGDYSITDLADVFSVSRPTVYRTLEPKQPTPPTRPSGG
jgi:hypothetical protein